MPLAEASSAIPRTKQNDVISKTDFRRNLDSLPDEIVLP